MFGRAFVLRRGFADTERKRKEFNLGLRDRSIAGTAARSRTRKC